MDIFHDASVMTSQQIIQPETFHNTKLACRPTGCCIVEIRNPSQRIHIGPTSCVYNQLFMQIPMDMTMDINDATPYSMKYIKKPLVC